MALDTEVGEDPPDIGGSPGSDVRSNRTSGTDPPSTPLGPFVGARSLLRRGMMTFSSLCNASPQDLSRQSILPHEPRTFDRDIAAYTVISNQNGSITDASVVHQNRHSNNKNKNKNKEEETLTDLLTSNLIYQPLQTQIVVAPLDRIYRFHRKSLHVLRTHHLLLYLQNH